MESTASPRVKKSSSDVTLAAMEPNISRMQWGRCRAIISPVSLPHIAQWMRDIVGGIRATFSQRRTVLRSSRGT